MFKPLKAMAFHYLEKDAELGGQNEEYRYCLLRKWSKEPKLAVFILLNPSTADANKDDRTITRCRKFARSHGCGAMIVVNLFAYRTTHPKDLELKLVEGIDIIGPKNDEYVIDAVRKGDLVIAAWSDLGALNARDKQVVDLLKKENLFTKIHYLKKTKKGNPWHPLYLKTHERAKLGL